MTEGELERMRKMGGFLDIRRLPDGSVAGVQPQVTTWSLVLGVTHWGWRYRFCYETLCDALAAFRSVQGESDIPDGWLACRPEVRVGKGRDSRYPTPEELRRLRRWSDD
jgi:hypothetical protein